MSTPTVSPALARAQRSLDGLSLGDALGERFFIPDNLQGLLTRSLPSLPWTVTDDTEMAIAVFDVLKALGCIDQDMLARTFASRFARDPMRGYGAGAGHLLREMLMGGSWRALSRGLFEGQGSFGNGGAMRAAPLGAFFADASDDELITQATLSAEVTHANPEGQAGAVAVALAAAYAWRTKDQPLVERAKLLQFVCDSMPDTQTRAGIAQALALGLDASVALAASVLGTGQRVSAMDTVPFALWCAARALGDYEEAFWITVSGLGDRDTTCAIVGGIVALRSAPPARWLEQREPLRHDAL
ncbi:MAG: ADP-ribosylglycohydrolase family protein [Deltaproteobacteria bacterium]|nr:ADP-ribosylglycohydrolase family protein [Deltaproteobacteria bacterium]